MRHSVAIAALLSALGCHDECDSRRCQPIDVEAEPGDSIVELETEFSLAAFEIEGWSSSVRLAGGAIAIHSDDLTCVASHDHPCSITIRHLRFSIDSVHVDTTDGKLFLDRPNIAVAAPLDLVDSGFGFVIPTGTPIRTCMAVNGRSDAALLPLGTPASLNIDGINNGFVIEGVFPVGFQGGNDQCTRFDASLNVAASGKLR